MERAEGPAELKNSSNMAKIVKQKRKEKILVQVAHSYVDSRYPEPSLLTTHYIVFSNNNTHLFCYAGLAVSDTGIIQEKAEIVTYISQVETISYTESILLGDPFGYLSEWPAFKWLKNLFTFCLFKLFVYIFF